MIPEFGQYCLALAWALSLALAAIPLAGAIRGDVRMMAVCRPAAWALFALIAIAFGCLMNAFATNDFSVALVATHSNRALPLPYRLAATWGSHEGSMLLWVLMLSGWSAAVALFNRRLAPTLAARVQSVLGWLTFGFLAFLLFTSNPFERALPIPPDGRDLNPLLQDPGMVFHPPLLYMGYVGFSVAFAFALAGLLEGRFDAAWARWSRPWTTVAWSFLTLGICLGSFWAYYELGWGGWWFWDPVENASFMPWLAGTALLHSLAVTEKRGAFRSWTVLLALLAFSLSLMGTFLVRSGVLTSVHAFATDPARGNFILAFLALVVGGSLVLFAWRAPRIGLGPGFSLISRESMLLANNVALTVALAAVLLGTLYPLALETLGLGKISVGPPYFEAVFYPLMAPALFLMAVGPLARWQDSDALDLARRLRWAFVVAILLAVLLPLTVGPFKPLTSTGLALAFWIACGVLTGILDTLRDSSGHPRARRLRMISRSAWGMHLAHLGVAVFIVGVTLVKSYEIDREARMMVGDSITLNDYQLRFDSLQPANGPNYDATLGRFTLSRDDQMVARLAPEKRIYHASGQSMTEAAIDHGLSRDVYVSIGEPLPSGAWTVKLHVKPFVNWIWLGCVLMATGGFVSVSDRRYRARQSRAAPAAMATT